MSSFATVSDLREPSVLTSSTFCSTMPRSIRSLLLSRSKSDHCKAKHSDIRSPKHTHSRAIVLNGSLSSVFNFWNSSTVRLRGFRIRFLAPFTTTSSIGFRAIGTAPDHMASSMSMYSMFRTWDLLFGESARLRFLPGQGFQFAKQTSRSKECPSRQSLAFVSILLDRPLHPKTERIKDEETENWPDSV